LMLIFYTSCGGQNKPAPSKDGKPQTKDLVTSPGSNEKNFTNYEYTDSIGKRLIIQNSFPKGGPYADPNGKQYFKVIFWTRLINETDNTLELKIDFPVDLYEVPGLSGKYYKVLVPPDTMTIDKESLYDYGMTGLKPFLDNNIHKPSSLKRTINPKESSGFYVLILFDKGVGGPVRTELSIRGQNLFYKIKIDGVRTNTKSSDKEINAGSINLKNLILKK